MASPPIAAGRRRRREISPCRSLHNASSAETAYSIPSSASHSPTSRPITASVTITTPSKRKPKSGNRPTKCRRSTLVYIAVVSAVLSTTLLANLARFATVLDHSQEETLAAWQNLSLPSYSTITISTPNTTLALLYPPGLMGGYRNQVIRFVSLCVHAVEHNMTALFLPSLLWSTQLVTGQQDSKKLGPWQPIPMEWIFDVEHWNAYSKTHPDSRLPSLVRDLPDSDCWLQTTKTNANATIDSSDQSMTPLRQAVWNQGTLRAIANLTKQLVAGQLPSFNLRKQDFYPAVQHCQNPVVYGGGRSFGRLWNDYMRHRNKKGGHDIPYQQDIHVLQALRPAPVWRRAAQHCVQQHINIVPTATTATRQQQQLPLRYLALHARIELDMMAHTCGRNMEWNLTKIVGQIQDFDVDGIFVAVSREGMQGSGNDKLYIKFQSHADDNQQTMDRLVRYGLDRGKKVPSSTTRIANEIAESTPTRIPFFECGEGLLQEYYTSHASVPDHGSLLHSAVNFDIACNAEIFVGTKGSSYSTDVWTTRYHQGKGASNYEYTQDGIQKIENEGLPAPHINCKK